MTFDANHLLRLLNPHLNLHDAVVRSAPIFVLGACRYSGTDLIGDICSRTMPTCRDPLDATRFWQHLLAPLLTHLACYDASPTSAPTERMTPTILRVAYRRFLESLLAETVREGERWAMTLSQASSEHAALLRWLFPDARIAFMLRNPFECLRQLRTEEARGHHVFDRWPDRPLTPTVLADHWATNARSYLNDYLRLDALLVRYEELIAGNWAPLERHLDLELAGPTNARSDPTDVVADVPTSLLCDFRMRVADVASQLGYEDPMCSAATESSAECQQTPPAKVCVLVPVAHHIEPACEAGLRQLEDAGYCVRRVPGFSAIDQARNALASAALIDGFEELIWIDSDIAFEIQDVERLRSQPQSIVCGLYPKKGMRALACHFLPGTSEVVFGEAGGLMEVRYCGAGFMRVRRHVYDEIQRQQELWVCNDHAGRAIVPFYQPLTIEEDGIRWYLAEDYAYCERARRAGFQIMADTRIRLRHIGSYEYSWEESGRPITRYETFRLRLDGVPAGNRNSDGRT